MLVIRTSFVSTTNLPSSFSDSLFLKNILRSAPCSGNLRSTRRIVLAAVDAVLDCPPLVTELSRSLSLVSAAERHLGAIAVIFLQSTESEDVAKCFVQTA